MCAGWSSGRAWMVSRVFGLGNTFLLLGFLLLAKVVSRTENDRIAYFGDEEDGVDCVVEDVGTD